VAGEMLSVEENKGKHFR